MPQPRPYPTVLLVLLAALALVGWQYLKHAVERQVNELITPSAPTPEDLRREANWLASQEPDVPITPLADEDTVITLTRTGCFGICPDYRVSIDGWGHVGFSGHSYVCQARPAPIEVDRIAVAQVIQGLRAVDFETMSSYTHRGGGDAPVVTIVLKRGTDTHVVQHDYEDHRAPRLLSWIEDKIDEVAKTPQWVGISEGTRRVCTLPDGTKVQITYDHRAPLS